MFDALVNLIRKSGWTALTPFTPQEVREEIGKSKAFEEARTTMAERARQQQADILERSAAIGVANRATEFKAVNGLGEKFLSGIPVEVIAQNQALYGHGCWDDEQFLREFWRDNPQFRAKTTRGTRGQEYGGRG